MQTSLFDSVATTPSEGIALGDRVAWKAGHDSLVGLLVFRGPRLGFYAFSEHWRSRTDYEEFMKYAGLRRGSRDAWLHQPGEFAIARNRNGWYAIGQGVAMEKAGG